MSFMDELKKITRPYDDDSSLIDDDVDMDAMDEPVYTSPRTTVAPQQPAPTPVETPITMGAAPMGGMNTMGAAMNTTVETPRPAVSPMGSMGIAADITKYRVVLVQPEKFDSATMIANHLRQGNAVVLNCEDTDKDVARRVVDFLSGCAFALDGCIKKAANNVYILVPRDVGVDQHEEEDDDEA